MVLGSAGFLCEIHPLQRLREQQQGWGWPGAVMGSMQGPESWDGAKQCAWGCQPGMRPSRLLWEGKLRQDRGWGDAFPQAGAVCTHTRVHTCAHVHARRPLPPPCPVTSVSRAAASPSRPPLPLQPPPDTLRALLLVFLKLLFPRLLRTGLRGSGAWGSGAGAGGARGGPAAALGTGGCWPHWGPLDGCTPKVPWDVGG